MSKQSYRSKCCNAKVKTEGIPDFLGSKEICTINFSCLQCGKPCDVVKLKGHKRKVRTVEKSKIITTLGAHLKMSAVKKRIQAQKRRLDFQGEMIQKLPELLDGITIDPTKGVILTPKKKRQLAELQKMEQKLSKSKAKKSR